jgi:WD40 repeat protein
VGLVVCLGLLGIGPGLRRIRWGDARAAGGKTAFPAQEEPVQGQLPAWAMLAPPAGHLTRVTCLAFSPDGRRLLSGSEDRTLLVWDLASGEIVHRLRGHSAFVGACTFLPDGRAVSGGWGGEVILWDLETGREQRRLEGLGRVNAVNALAARGDGGEVLAGSVYGKVLGWDPRNGRETFRRTDGLKKPIWAMGYTAAGERYAGGDDGRIVVWDAAEAERSIDHEASSAAALPGGRFLIGAEGEVRLVDRDGALVRRYPGHRGWAYGLAFGLREERFVAGDGRGQVQLWSLQGARPQCALPGIQGGIFAAAVHPDGDRLAVAGDAGIIWLARGADCRVLGTLASGQSRIYGTAAREQVALGGGAGGLSLWAPGTWRPRENQAVHAGEIISLDALPRGGWVSGGADHEVFFTLPGGPPRAAGHHRNQVWEVRTLPDGSGAVAVDGAREVWLHPQGGAARLLATLPGSGELYALAIAPDGRSAVVGGKGNSVYRITLPEGRVTATWPRAGRPQGAQTAFAYRPDGAWLAEGNTRGEVHLRDAASGEVLRRLAGLTDQVNGLVFTPTDLWAPDSSGRLCRWPLAGGQDPDRSFDEGAPILDLAQTRDGRYLIAALEDGRAAVRSLPDGHPVAHLIPLRDGSWATLHADGRFEYQGAAAAALRVVLPGRGGAYTLGELAQKTRNLFLSLNEPTLTALPGGHIQLAATLFSPHGPPSAFLDGVPLSLIRPLPDNPIAYEATILLGDAPGSAHTLTIRDAQDHKAEKSFTLPDDEGLWAPNGRRRALVIGEHRYTHPTTPPLACAAEDAELMTQVLGAAAGWGLGGQDLVTAIDLNGQDLASTVERFLTQDARPDDTLLLYFAGHGTSRAGETYLLPVDHGFAPPEHDLAAAKLWQWLDASPARTVVAIVDACQAGGMIQLQRSATTRPRRALVMAAGSAAACDAAGSIFTRAFVDALRDVRQIHPRSGAVTLQRAFFYAQNAALEHNQEPNWSGGLGLLPLYWPQDPAAHAQDAGTANASPVSVLGVKALAYQQVVAQGLQVTGGALEVQVRFLRAVESILLRLFQGDTEYLIDETTSQNTRPGTPPVRLPWPTGGHSHVPFPLRKKLESGAYRVEVQPCRKNPQGQLDCKTLPVSIVRFQYPPQ